MRTLCFVCFTVVLLYQAYGHEIVEEKEVVEEIEPENLLKDRYFQNMSLWTTFQPEVVIADWKNNKSIRAANCTQKDNTNITKQYCDCESKSSPIMIDATKAYEFSIYVQAMNQHHMKNFFGFYVYDSNAEKVVDSWMKPYFKKSVNSNHAWQKWTAHIYPHTFMDRNNDGKPNFLNSKTNGEDWIWPSNATYVSMRFGSCYYGTGRIGRDTETVRVARHVVDPLGITLFAYPSIREIELPAILDLSHPSMIFNVTNSEQWFSAANYSGMAFVNGMHTHIARLEETKVLNKCYYPWGITHLFQIDNHKTYEFSVWILSTGNDLDNFLGFQAFDMAFSPLMVGNTFKPYFKRSESDSKMWTRWNGFVLAAMDNTTVPTYYANGQSFKWPSGSVYAQLRFGTCYGDGKDEGKTYFAYPEVVDYNLKP